MTNPALAIIDQIARETAELERLKEWVRDAAKSNRAWLASLERDLARARTQA